MTDIASLPITDIWPETPPTPAELRELDAKLDAIAAKLGLVRDCRFSDDAEQAA